MNLQYHSRKRAFISTASLLLLSSASLMAQGQSQTEELLFVLGVSRHGARSPQTVMPFSSNGVNFQNES